MDISARIFGLSSWSLLVPQALEGVAAVALLHAAVKRWFGPGAGLLAGAVLATTPVATLMFRFDNLDALLVLLLVAGAYAVTRAIEDGRTRWLVFAGALVGFGFLTKMLQAFLVLPAFGAAYLVAGPPRLGRRVWQLAAGALALLGAAGWWVAIVALIPASARPYIGGSTDNSVLGLALGYNGLGRLTGNETGSVGGGTGSVGGGTGGFGWGGATGLTRLFSAEMGGQAAWLIPAALVALAGLAWATRRKARSNHARPAILLWGGWLLVTAGVFRLRPVAGFLHLSLALAHTPHECGNRAVITMIATFMGWLRHTPARPRRRLGETQAGRGSVRRQDLERLARAHGVQPAYSDWRGRRKRVPTQTLTAILDVLGGPARLSSAAAVAPVGRSEASASRGEDPQAPPVPVARAWGFAVQLYSLRSRESWGHGDLHDLAELARWSARDFGAGFVLVNPLHAAEPFPPVSASPYLPMSRRYVSPLYLRVEDVPEYAQLPASGREQIAAHAAPLRDQNRTGELIDRDAVWAAKRAALELIHQVPRSHPRRAAFERFQRERGESLRDWSTWCALAEEHGPDWRCWPPGLKTPRSDAVARERERLRSNVEFHAWLQWLLDGQLAYANQAAVSTGMPIGLVCDIAVGAHPGGADSWSNQDVLATGMSTGAPPDEFNQLGQDWTQPPWHPLRLAEHGYRPLRDLISAPLGHAGGLRVDHVMGLFRLWWMPEGSTPDRGAYVRYDHHATVGELTRAAARTGAVAIGEDLGTVEPWVRRFLAGRGVLGTSMLWFERRADGSPRPASAWRRECLATVGTHDMPPAASFLTGEHVALRAKLGLLTQDQESERRDAAASVAAWRDLLDRMGLLPRGPQSGTDGTAQLTAALYAFLARTPARLIAVSLADAVGDRRPQNMPGTSDEYPNWRLPLTDAAGSAVLLEDLPACPGIPAVARAVTTASLSPP